MALSGFGQTYFVSLSTPYFRQAFGLSDGELGAAYAIGTFASAITLTWAGRLIDYMSVRSFIWMVALLLASACFMIAISANSIALSVSFYFLRLGGQGLMVHTALTTTARAFPFNTGKALSVAALGTSGGQALFPMAAVFVMDLFGWRVGWGINAVVVIIGVFLSLFFLPAGVDRPLRKRKQAGDRSKLASPPLWGDIRLLFALPAILASPFIVTGFFFNQARLAEQKEWNGSWVASGFVVFATVQAIAVIGIGPAIDRFGTRRLFPLFLIPQAAGMLLVGVCSAAWVGPGYMALMAISAAAGSTLATTLWVELFGPFELARVRSAVEAGSVIVTGISPIIMGILIDAGVSLAAQAIGCCIYTILASVLASYLPVTRPIMDIRVADQR